MIQFNLLPDIKLDYIKAQKSKRLVFSISVIVAVGSIILMLISLSLLGVRKAQVNSLNKQIDESSKKLSNIKDLDKVLTIQNQLNSVLGLHAKKPAVARIFDYALQVTPVNASIAQLNIDFNTSSLKLSGSADNLTTINKFVDTLKFTDYKLNNETKKAFKSVILDSFSRADQSSSYSISVIFEPALFDINSQVSLSVPQNYITTRSVTEQPSAFGNQQQGGQ